MALIAVLFSIVTILFFTGIGFAWGNFFQLQKVENRLDNIDYILNAQAEQMHLLESAVNP